TEILRSLVDPHETILRPSPKNDQDLAIAGDNSWILSFDNLSELKPWLSDALCRVSTGASFATRKLYTDGEEWSISLSRPVLLNGIDSQMVSRNDLRDRALFLSLPAIPDDKRRTKKEVWKQVEEARPYVLGALLDAAATGLRRLSEVKLDATPRMADFVTWVEACSPAIGWAPNEYVNLYMRSREAADQQSLGLWEVMPALLAILEQNPVFEGTYGELLRSLNDAIDKLGTVYYCSYEWPSSPRKL